MSLLSLCERFHTLPSAVLDEDAGLLRLLEIERLVLEVRPDYWAEVRGEGGIDG